jgi:type I restriction enzyme S subunit
MTPPGYKQTEVGVIPEEWEVKSLFDLAERRKDLFDDGDWIEAEYLTDGGIRLIQTGNIGEGNFADKQSKKYISAESFKKLRCKDLQVGDILICRLAEPAGRACILPYIDEERVITAVDVTIFRPPPSIANRLYLVNVFNTPRWFQLVNERCGGSTRTRIARGELGKIEVPVPPLPEQRVIATALSDVDALLDALDRLIAKQRDLKQAAMQQLLTGQTRLPGFTGKWVDTTLGEIGQCIIGLTYKPENVVEHGLLVLRSSNVQNGRLAYNDNVHVNLKVADHLYTRLGDILICVRNGSRALIGKCAVIDDAALGVTFGAFMSVYRTKHWRFIIHAFQSGDIQRQIRDNIGATINQITNKDMKAFRLKLPPEDEQTAIATVLSDMDLELAALEQRRDKTRALKQGMMQELLTGRTRLRPGNAEPQLGASMKSQ